MLRALAELEEDANDVGDGGKGGEAGREDGECRYACDGGGGVAVFPLPTTPPPTPPTTLPPTESRVNGNGKEEAGRGNEAEGTYKRRCCLDEALGVGPDDEALGVGPDDGEDVGTDEDMEKPEGEATVAGASFRRLLAAGF